MGIMMALDRKWITPLMAGSMLVSGMSGTLMFFDVANDLQEEIHEWLGIVLMSGAICHVLLNFQSLKKQLQTSRGKWIFVGFATLMALSFLGGFGGDGDYDGEDDDD
jgi:hypothetical protein